MVVSGLEDTLVGFLDLLLFVKLWVLCFCSALGMWFSFVIDLKKMDTLAGHVHCCYGRSLCWVI